MVYLQQILNKLIEILLESSPYILLGFLIAGVLHILLPESLFARIFGRKGIAPLLRAIGLGSLIPVCSCGVVPIGLGAYRGGAGTGTVLAFMTAAPVLSPASFLLSVKLLGLELTLWQVLMTATGSLVLGLIANRWFREYQAAPKKTSRLFALNSVSSGPACCGNSSHQEHLPTLHAEKSCCQPPASQQQLKTPLQKVHELAHWLFVEFGPSVSLDMLFGLLFAATVLTFVPTEWIVLLTGSKTLWSLLLVILVALPVYTCSMAAIPVVFSFLAAGMSPGAAVAFIIAGPATNFGEINALRSQISWKVALYYFASLLIVAVISGAMIDHLIRPDTSFIVSSAVEHHHQHLTAGSWLEWASLSILVLLMLTEIVNRLRRTFHRKPTASSPQPSEHNTQHILESIPRS